MSFRHIWRTHFKVSWVLNHISAWNLCSSNPSQAAGLPETSTWPQNYLFWFFWGSVGHSSQGRELKLTVKSQRLSVTAHLMNQFQGWGTTLKPVDFKARFFPLNRLFMPWWICNVWHDTEEHNIPYISFIITLKQAAVSKLSLSFIHCMWDRFHLIKKRKLTAHRWQLSQLQVVKVSFRSERRLHPAEMNNDQDTTSFNPVPLFPLLVWLSSEEVSLQLHMRKQIIC